MSSLNITKRGVVQITSADTGTSKDIALPGDAIKTGSSFRIVSVREQRKRVRVQRVTFAITDVSVSPLTAALDPEVDLEAAELASISIRENRTGTKRGATLKLTDVDEVTCEFEVAAGDTIDIEAEVKETLKELGATARILDDETLRIEWDRELEDNETITVTYEVTDLDDIGDMLLELDFKAVQTLGLLGKNTIQDLINRDTVGNVVSYRSRGFDTKANAEAATPDLAEGSDFETGEYLRIVTTQEIDIAKNDRTLLYRVQTKLGDTPGIS